MQAITREEFSWSALAFLFSCWWHMRLMMCGFLARRELSLPLHVRRSRMR